MDQKKRAVITRPFGREASIVMEKDGNNQALSADFALFLGGLTAIYIRNENCAYGHPSCDWHLRMGGNLEGAAVNAGVFKGFH